MAAFAVLAAASCNKQDLPYDLAGTEHSVVINISKVAGSSTTLSTDMNDGNYQLLLTIPKQQGDYSMLKEAQVQAIYTPGTGDKKSAIVVTGITEFPATVKINIKDACAKLGVQTIAVGDRIEFTPCHTLKSGTQVNGWSELTGFNNQAFTGWEMENGAAFAFRVSYTAFAPFQKEKFQGDAVPWVDNVGGAGTCKVTQVSKVPEKMPVGVSESDLVGLRVEGPFWWEEEDEGLDMWINTQDFTLIIPDQVMSASFVYPGLGQTGYAKNCEGEVDTLKNTLTFYYYPWFDPGYSWGQGFTVTIKF